MSNSCSKRPIVPITLLLLIGALIMVQGPTNYYSGFTSSAYPSTEGHLVMLTEDSPTYTIDIPGYLIKLVITDLTTSGGSIRINAYNADNAILLNLHGIYRIVEDGIAIDGREYGKTLNFTKEDSDVEVIFTIEEWYLPPAIDVVMAPLVQFFMYGAVLFGIAFYLLFKIETECCKFHGQSRWRRTEGPLSIIIFTVLCASLAMPYIYGSTHGNYTERHMTDRSSLELTYTLTESIPEVMVDLVVYIEGEFDSVKMQIEDFTTSESIRIRTLADTRVLAYLPLVDRFSESWIEIDIQDESSHTLELRRIEADTVVSFDLVIIGTYTGRIADPTIPILLVGIAIAPASLALIRARDIKRKLDMIEDERYNSYAQSQQQ